MNLTRISARWIKDSNSTDGTILLAHGKKNRTLFRGFVHLLIDTAVRCWDCMLESLKGNPDLTYRGREKLKSLVDSRNHDMNNSDGAVVDLTNGDANVE